MLLYKTFIDANIAETRTIKISSNEVVGGATKGGGKEELTNFQQQITLHTALNPGS